MPAHAPRFETISKSTTLSAAAFAPHAELAEVLARMAPTQEDANCSNQDPLDDRRGQESRVAREKLATSGNNLRSKETGVPTAQLTMLFFVHPYRDLRVLIDKYTSVQRIRARKEQVHCCIRRDRHVIIPS